MAELGLGQTALQQPGGERFVGRELRQLIDLVVRLQDHERRLPADSNVPLLDYLTSATIPDLALPSYYVMAGDETRFVEDETQLTALLERLRAKKGTDLVVYEGPESPCRREDADVEVHALLLATE